MYPSHLGMGETIDLDLFPTAGRPEVVLSHEYVANAVGRRNTSSTIADEVNLYNYVRNNPLIYTDPSGEAIQNGAAVACVCAGVGLYQVIAGIICDSLHTKAVKKGLIGKDPGAHKRHCYVSCCLNKANLWIPLAAPAIGIGWEICTGGIFNPRDAARDLEADFYGIYGSYLDNCAKHCDKLTV
jgi:hypothetical protein